MNFKDFTRSGHCEGLRLIAINMSSTMQRNPNIENLKAAKYTMDKYFEAYYLEIELWILKESGQ